MSKGRQDAGPEWRAICAQIRKELLLVCPLSNRRFTRETGTFSRQWVTWSSGVSLANLRRMLDEQLPSSPDTVEKLAAFLGMQIVLKRVSPLPKPPHDIDELIPVQRTGGGEKLRPRRRNSVRAVPRRSGGR